VAVLGLGFKPGTDDLRESPVISLIRHLWEDGIGVLVHDPDIHLETMLGSNREYLNRQLPQINGILRSRIEEVFEGCDTVVVCQRRQEFRDAMLQLSRRVAVVDLVRLFDGPSELAGSNYVGMSWSQSGATVTTA